jgi:hypothetical protein
MNHFEQSIRDSREATNSLRPPPSFGKPPPATRYLLVIAIITAIVLAGVVISYVAQIPPAHLLIIATGVLWLGWQIRKGRRPR